MASRAISASDVLPLCAYSQYVAGVWLLAAMDQAIATGQAPGANSIRLYPFFIYKTVPADRLGMVVTTLQAGGNSQAAIYAASATTNKPTTLEISSASMSCAATGVVESTVAHTFAPGLYWGASNCDNATNTFDACGSTSTWMARSIGSTSQASCMTTGGGTLSGYTLAQAFGTWPADLTGQTFTELTTSQRIPLIQFRVA